MPDPARHPARPAQLDGAALGAVTAGLLRLHRGAGSPVPRWPELPVLVVLPWADPSQVDDTGFPLLARSLAGTGDPVDTLCHLRPEPAWAAVGLLVQGWSRHGPDAVDWRTLARAGGRVRDDPEARRVTMLQMVARSGAMALGLLGDGDDEPECHATDDTVSPRGPTGPVVEGMRRLFGLPTPPCPVTSDELWAAVWLADVADDCERRRGGRPRSWAGIARRHPAMRALERAGARPGPDWLVPAGRVFARHQSWEAVQLACVTGEAVVEGLTASVAAWCDAGMFARLVLRRVPAVWQSMPRLRAGLPAAHCRRVEVALDAWGVGWAPPTPDAVDEPP